MEFLLEIGKQYGFGAIIVIGIAIFFNNVWKAQEERMKLQEEKIAKYIDIERQEKAQEKELNNKLMDVVNNTLREITFTLRSIQDTLTTNNCKFDSLSVKVDKLSDKVQVIENRIEKSN